MTTVQLGISLVPATERLDRIRELPVGYLAGEPLAGDIAPHVRGSG